MILKKVARFRKILENRNINIRFVKINGAIIEINRKIIDIIVDDNLIINTGLYSSITLKMDNIYDFNIENINIINPDIETIDLNVKLKELL